MVQRYIEVPEAEVATCMHEHFAGDWVKYEDYAALHAAAAALLAESAKVYKDYNETIAPEFMDMQTLQELADLL